LNCKGEFAGKHEICGVTIPEARHQTVDPSEKQGILSLKYQIKCKIYLTFKCSLAMVMSNRFDIITAAGGLHK